MKENSVLKSSQVRSRVQPSVWWRLLAVSQGGNQGLDPSHLYSCEQFLLAPVIPLTLLGARISPASKAWRPAPCLSLGVFVELLPALSLTILPKTSCSSRPFVTPIAKPGSAEFLFLTEHPSVRLSHGMDTSVHPAEQDVRFSEPYNPVVVEGRVAEVCNQELLGSSF